MRINRLLFLALLIILFSCKQKLKKDNNVSKLNDTNIGNNEKPEKESFKVEVNNLAIEFTKFIPENYSMLDFASSDLNLDGIQDIILVLKRNREDILSDIIDHPEKRPLLVLLRDADKKLKLKRKNNITV